MGANEKKKPTLIRGRAPISPDFFFSSRRRHTSYWRDWSSDVCSSDLGISGDDSMRGLDIRMNQVLKHLPLHAARLRKRLGNRHDRAVVLEHLDDVLPGVSHFGHVAALVPDLHELPHSVFQTPIRNSVAVRIEDLLRPLLEEPHDGVPPELFLDEIQGAEGHVRVRLREEGRGALAQVEERSRSAAATRPERPLDERLRLEHVQLFQRGHLGDPELLRDVRERNGPAELEGQEDLLLGGREARLEASCVHLIDQYHGLPNGRPISYTYSFTKSRVWGHPSPMLRKFEEDGDDAAPVQIKAEADCLSSSVGSR